MNVSDIWLSYWGLIVEVFLPWLFGVLILSLIISAAYRTLVIGSKKERVILIVAFISLGGAVGVMAGSSKTPVLGTFLPAFLTFITAILGYLFGKESLLEWRPVIPFCLFGLLLSSVLNMYFGTVIKGKSIDQERKYQVWLLEHNLKLEMQKAMFMRTIENGGNVIFSSSKTQ